MSPRSSPCSRCAGRDYRGSSPRRPPPSNPRLPAPQIQSSRAADRHPESSPRRFIIFVGHQWFLESGWRFAPQPTGQTAMTTANPPARYRPIEGARAGGSLFRGYTTARDTTRVRRACRFATGSPGEVCVRLAAVQLNRRPDVTGVLQLLPDPFSASASFFSSASPSAPSAPSHFRARNRRTTAARAALALPICG